MIITIPFSGFYYTIHGDKMDWELEAMAEEEGVDDYNELEVDMAAWRNRVAEVYSDYLQEMTGYPWKFKEVRSPKFYNFENDYIRVEVDPATLRKIQVTALYKEGFHKFVEEFCADRPGFISYIPKDLEQWPLEWEERHYTVALEFLVQEMNLYMEEDISEDMRCNGGYCAPFCGE